MLDLRVLRDHWTEDGARAVFAQLVTQCVRRTYPSARAIQPDPGDEGVDTFVGEFEADLRVYQAKYFCDGVGRSQQGQIRESWKRCHGSKYFKKVVLWTLCLPTDLTIDEERWWQKWKKKESANMNCPVELWTHSDFLRFSAVQELKRIFDLAFRRLNAELSMEDVLAAMAASPAPLEIKPLPTGSHLGDAVFVKKIEAAGITQHRAARTAFYNFELLRQKILQGGETHQAEALQSLQENVFDLWEGAYNEGDPSALGKPLYSRINKLIAEEDQGRLRTSLPATVLHKKGALHYWADICEAGWTSDFKKIGKEE